MTTSLKELFEEMRKKIMFSLPGNNPARLQTKYLIADIIDNTYKKVKKEAVEVLWCDKGVGTASCLDWKHKKRIIEAIPLEKFKEKKP